MAEGIYTFQKIRDLARASFLCRFVLMPRLRWSSEQIQAHQEKRLRRLLKFVLKKSPFYAKHLQGVDPEKSPLSEIPTLTKDQMLTHYDEIITDKRLNFKELNAHLDQMTHDVYYQNHHKVFRSGASSGNPAIMAYNSREFSYVLAQVLQSAKGLVKMPITRRIRAANIYSRTPTHDSVRISQSFQIGLHRVKDFAVDTPIAQLVQELNQFRPDVLNGYPSVITELSHQKLQGNLRTNPQAIFLGSEPLTPTMREDIHQAFGMEPFDHYGTTEAIIMASECPLHHGYHLSDDMHIIEVVDRKNQPVPPGEEGFKVLVTNLYAFSQPIIRYEVSDILVLDPDSRRCPCGNPFRRLKRIIGRQEDLFQFQNTRKETVSLGHEELRNAMAKCDNLRQFQIIQQNNEIIVNAFLRDKSRENRTRDQIVKVLSALLQKIEVKIARISCNFVDSLERSPQASQKFRQIWSQDKNGL